MKKTYISPELQIERFTFTDILTESGIGDNNVDIEDPFKDPEL